MRLILLRLFSIAIAAVPAVIGAAESKNPFGETVIAVIVWLMILALAAVCVGLLIAAVAQSVFHVQERGRGPSPADQPSLD